MLNFDTKANPFHLNTVNNSVHAPLTHLPNMVASSRRPIMNSIATTLIRPKNEFCRNHNHTRSQLVDIRNRRGYIVRKKMSNRAVIHGIQAGQISRQVTTTPLKRMYISDIQRTKNTVRLIVVAPRGENRLILTKADRRNMASCGNIINGHCHLGQGKSVKFAGELKFERGKFVGANTWTGTYHTPGLDTSAGREVLTQLVYALRTEGVPSSEIRRAKYSYFRAGRGWPMVTENISDHWSRLSDYRRNATYVK